MWIFFLLFLTGSSASGFYGFSVKRSHHQVSAYVNYFDYQGYPQMKPIISSLGNNDTIIVTDNICTSLGTKFYYSIGDIVIFETDIKTRSVSSHTEPHWYNVVASSLSRFAVITSIGLEIINADYSINTTITNVVFDGKWPLIFNDQSLLGRNQRTGQYVWWSFLINYYKSASFLGNYSPLSMFYNGTAQYIFGDSDNGSALIIVPDQGAPSTVPYRDIYPGSMITAVTRVNNQPVFLVSTTKGIYYCIDNNVCILESNLFPQSCITSV